MTLAVGYIRPAARFINKVLLLLFFCFCLACSYSFGILSMAE